ncbi:MAG: hypothetical protein COA67_06840 [Lutibacter sp.]|nr:MAG: hypothetical protein COA67_06840 [Lutibacter sp.]
MKKLIVAFVICVFYFAIGFSQDSIVNGITEVNEAEIERLIISKKLDSARALLSKTKRTNYVDLLSKVTNNKKLSYKEYDTFITKITSSHKLDYGLISNFINVYVKLPIDKSIINLDYTSIKFAQITTLRNNANLDEASTQNEVLEKYIDQFNINSKEVKIEKAYVSIHGAVISLIESDLERGKKILNENLKVAKQYDDKLLEIASLYYLSDFLVAEGKLDRFIEVIEKSLALEEQLSKKSPYYESTIEHAINGYTFKGGYDKRVQSLLEELYNSPTSKVNSYSLYAQYLSKLDTDSNVKKEIFKKFGVSNSKEFCKLIEEKTKSLLTDNDFYFILIEASNLLEQDNYLKEAIRYQERAVKLTRKIYGKDLAISLANYNTQQAVKIKDIEIEHQKKRSNIFITSATIIGLLLLISLFYLRESIKQSKRLKEKNRIIDESLKEKKLLLKEVHHRVKNNFQIIFSLLELQSKGVVDKKALEFVNEGKNRVKSMALIHQKLYQNNNGLIDFEEYIQLLVREITAVYASNKKVKIKVDSKGMQFDVDTAIPLGLIINEIITNSYKYAFNKIEGNELNISIKKLKNTPDYTLTIADNGPGLDENINLSKVKSLGLRLITRLVKQLQGKLEQTNEDGLKFVITFKDIHARKAIS